jgi:hypothetical protein
MRKWLLLGLVAACATASPAAAADWYRLYANDEELIFASRTGTVRGNVTEVELFVSHAEGDYHVVTEEVDCARRLYRDIDLVETRRDGFDTVADWTSFAAQDDPVYRFACQTTNLGRPLTNLHDTSDEHWYDVEQFGDDW